MLIITYRGEVADWTKLLQDIGQSPQSYNQDGHRILIKLLSNLGVVTTLKVITTVNTDNLEDIVNALSFVASDGILNKKEEFLRKGKQLKEIFNSQYKHESGYSFPFQHFFIVTQKHS